MPTPHIREISLDLVGPVAEWIDQVWGSLPAGDLVICKGHPDDITLFTTRFTAATTAAGDAEVAHIYGKYATSLGAVIHHLNKSLPASYVLGKTHHALYDLLLNFETEPLRRLLVWHDADILFTRKRHCFEEIMDSMIRAAYLNRQGWATYKEDGTPYQLDQRNLFVFPTQAWDQVAFLFERPTTAYSIRQQEPIVATLPFGLITFR